MKSFARIILAVGFLLSASFSVAANLLTNPNFDPELGLSGWTWDYADGSEFVVCGMGAECGNMHLSPSECCDQPGSNSVASNSSFFYIEELGQCVTGISANEAYDLGAWIRLTTPSGFEPGLPVIGLSWYSAADCSSPSGYSATRSAEPATWTRIAISGVVAPEGTHSARIFLMAGATGLAGTLVGMEFDSAFFGPAGTVPVELQSLTID